MWCRRCRWKAGSPAPLPRSLRPLACLHLDPALRRPMQQLQQLASPSAPSGMSRQSQCRHLELQLRHQLRSMLALCPQPQRCLQGRLLPPLRAPGFPRRRVRHLVTLATLVALVVVRHQATAPRQHPVPLASTRRMGRACNGYCLKGGLNQTLALLWGTPGPAPGGTQDPETPPGATLGVPPRVPPLLGNLPRVTPGWRYLQGCPQGNPGGGTPGHPRGYLWGYPVIPRGTSGGGAPR